MTALPGYSAFSLVEMMVVIAIIGILAALAIPIYTGLSRASEDEVANQVVTDMNNAVKMYAQAAEDIVTAAAADEVADELAVMDKLLTHEPPSASSPGLPGSPFLTGARAQWPSVESSDAKAYRVRWNGRYFELLKQGVEGRGLRVR